MRLAGCVVSTIDFVTDNSSLLVVSWADGTAVGSSGSSSTGLRRLSPQGLGVGVASITTLVAAISALVATIAGLLWGVAALVAAIAALVTVRAATISALVAVRNLLDVGDTGTAIAATVASTVAVAIGTGIDASEKGEGSECNLKVRRQTNGLVPCPAVASARITYQELHVEQASFVVVINETIS